MYLHQQCISNLISVIKFAELYIFSPDAHTAPAFTFTYFIKVNPKTEQSETYPCWAGVAVGVVEQIQQVVVILGVVHYRGVVRLCSS